MKRTIETIPDDVMTILTQYSWPGNIRELENVIERGVVLCQSQTFYVDESWLKEEGQRLTGPAPPLAATLVAREIEMIEAALAECQGRVSGVLGAAARLGIPRQTLESKIKALGINKHRFRNRQPTEA
jgi:formate hydrogenlyase transcriptional activator